MRQNQFLIPHQRGWMLRAALLGLLLVQHAVSGPTLRPDLVSQGMAAIKAGDFQSADDDFRDAVQASGPYAYHNIGTAEAAISGRELRAVCWLAAYLAAEPQAPDAVQTRDTISKLIEQRREKTLLLIQHFADLLPPPPTPAGSANTNPLLVPNWDNGPNHLQEEHDHVLQGFASSWISFGDFDAARWVMGMMGRIGWYGPKSDVCTTLVRAECNEATRLYEAGNVNASASLLAVAQKDAAMTFPGIVPDRDRPYSIAMAQLQIARDLVGKRKFDDARRFIAMTSGNSDNATNDDSQGSIATTKILLARAQLKAGDKEGARATLGDASRIAFAINKTGSPLKLETLRDLADAETEAGDLDGSKAALTAAVPLVVIYNDPDHARLEIVTAQLKARDKDGAQKTAALMTDPSLKAKALEAIATPPTPSKPGDQTPFPPLPSQYLANPPGTTTHSAVDAAQWMSLLELNLDAPCFTAFPDDADAANIALAIQREPVQMSKPVTAQDLSGSLELVCRRMIAAQAVVERLLKTQFGS